MTKLEGFEKLQVQALAEFAEEQERFPSGKRFAYLDALGAEVRAATTIGHVLHAVSKWYEEDSEMVCLFILRAMGVVAWTHRDIHT
jgi:hypothetical protein